MAGPPIADPRAAAWERRLWPAVIVAALAVPPLLALSLSHPHGIWMTVETVGHWAVWLVFATEVAVMLAVVRDRGAWISGHRFELLVVVLSSPLVPLALALAPALRLLVLVKAFKAFKLAKAVKLAKLHKSARLVRRRLAPRGGTSLAFGALSLGVALATVAYMLTGSSPLEGVQETAALVAAGMAATFGVNHLRRRAA